MPYVKIQRLKEHWELDTLDELLFDYERNLLLIKKYSKRFQSKRFRLSGKKARKYLRLNKHLSDELIRRTK